MSEEKEKERDAEKTWGFRLRQKLINMIRDVEAKYKLPPAEIKT